MSATIPSNRWTRSIPRIAPSEVGRARLPTLGLTCIGAGTACGWLIASGRAGVAAAVIVGALGVIVARLNPGVALAALMLIVLNGVPGVSTDIGLVQGFAVQDAAVVALAVMLYLHRGAPRSAAHARIYRAVMIWSALFSTWWLITFFRSVLLDDIPVKYAGYYGRDFLYLAVILPLVVQAHIPRPSLRQGAYLFAAGVTAYAVGQTISGITGSELLWLAHPMQVNEKMGLLRFYSPMNMVVTTCVIIAGAWLFTRKRLPGRRSGVAALFTLGTVAIALQLTRSNYFSLAVALMAGMAAYVALEGETGILLRRLMLLGLALTAIVFVGQISGLGESRIGGATDSVVARAESGVAGIEESNGTFGSRLQIDKQMLTVLGAQWPIGLGFLDPTVHYVGGLPYGAIRNTDVGVFNILMTMGAVGTGLLYAMIFYALVSVVSLLRCAPRSNSVRWWGYAGIVWIVWVLVGSWNLGVLFSVPGVMVTAAMLGGLAHLTMSPDSGAARRC